MEIANDNVFNLLMYPCKKMHLWYYDYIHYLNKPVQLNNILKYHGDQLIFTRDKESDELPITGFKIFYIRTTISMITFQEKNNYQIHRNFLKKYAQTYIKKYICYRIAYFLFKVG